MKVKKLTKPLFKMETLILYILVAIAYLLIIKLMIGRKNYITRKGVVNGIDTSGFKVGEVLFVDMDKPGCLTSKPFTFPTLEKAIESINYMIDKPHYIFKERDLYYVESGELMHVINSLPKDKNEPDINPNDRPGVYWNTETKTYEMHNDIPRQYLDYKYHRYKVISAERKQQCVRNYLSETCTSCIYNKSIPLYSSPTAIEKIGEFKYDECEMGFWKGKPYRISE